MDYEDGSPATNGLVGYLDPRARAQTVTGRNDRFNYHTGTMSALGHVIAHLLEHDLDDPFLELAAQADHQGPARACTKDKLSVDYYYWYYASLALNQFDGPDSPARPASTGDRGTRR